MLFNFRGGMKGARGTSRSAVAMRCETSSPPGRESEVCCRCCYLFWGCMLRLPLRKDSIPLLCSNRRPIPGRRTTGIIPAKRFSTLDQINAGNFNSLALAWAFPTAHNRTIKSTPLEVNGILYFSVPDNALGGGCALWP